MPPAGRLRATMKKYPGANEKAGPAPSRCPRAFAPPPSPRDKSETMGPLGLSFFALFCYIGEGASRLDGRPARDET